MIQKCLCQHCRRPIEFDDADFYSLRHDYFHWYGPKVNCPHCGKETEVYLNRPVAWVFRVPAKAWAIAASLTALAVFAISQPQKFSDSIQTLFASAISILAIGVVLAIYLAPAIIGRKKRHFNSLLVINIFLGWTLLGWVIALAWAVADDKPTTA